MMITPSKFTEYDLACAEMSELLGKEKLLDLKERGEKLLGEGKDSVTPEASALYMHLQAKVARLASMIERIDRKSEWLASAPAPKTALLAPLVCVEHSPKDPPFLGFMARRFEENRGRVDFDVLEELLKTKAIGHARLAFAGRFLLVIRPGREEDALRAFSEISDKVSATTARKVYETRIKYRTLQTELPTIMSVSAREIRWIG